MSFSARKNRNDKNTKNVLNLGTDSKSDLHDAILYVSLLIPYYIKKGFSSILGITITLMLFLYIVYNRYFRKTSEMIDGMEVPLLKDKYDLSVD